nr:serine hydrolase [Armatimonas sp.]
MMPLLATAALLIAPATPSARIFDFADPKGTNTVTICVDAPIEPVTGIAGGITGSAQFDLAHPEKTTGEIIVAVESIQFGNPNYANSVRGYALEGKKFPTLTCKLKKIVSGKEIEKGRFKGIVAVDFTVRGITKPLTIPLDVRYLPGMSKERDGRTEGDLMVIRTKFTIKRSDFGVAPGLSPLLATDNVEIGVALVGIAAKNPAPKAAVAPKTNPTAERMAFYKVPAATVVRLKNFEVAGVEHYGTATEKTLFPAGAQGRPIAALVALRLVQEGRLALDTDINSSLKSWKVPENEFTKQQPVTLRHLLSGTSGFTWEKYLGYSADAKLPTLDQVLRGEAPANTPPTTVHFLPGSKFVNSAEEILVLQKLIEDVTGQSWQGVVKSIFGPEIRSRYEAFPKGEEIAAGYDEEGELWPGGANANPALAAAGLWADPAEFGFAFGEILKVASGKSKLLELKYAPLLTEIPAGKQNSAFGCDDFGGRKLLYRGGNAKGFYCQCWADPKTGDGLVVFTNRDLCWKFANELRDAWLAEK